MERKLNIICSLKNEYLYGLLASLITMGVLLVSLSYGQMISGDKTFIVGDLYQQCAPFAHLFINKLLDGSNFYYSFNAGLGMNTSLIFAFYAFSPFNILYLFSDGSNINDIAILVFVFKAGLAAFSFNLYSRYNLNLRKSASIIFSVGYALTSYGIVILEMTSLYDGVYLLPLILVSIKYLVDKGKSLWITLLYTVLFISNFYSGYIVGLASFGYLILYLFCRDIDKNKLIKSLIRYSRSVLCAFFLSAFILAPTVYELLKQNAVDSDYIFSISPIWNIISFLFPFHIREYNSMTPYYYCGLPATLLLGAYFTNRKIKSKNKVICAVALGIAVLSMSIKQLYGFAHMFNNPNGYTYRYVYIIALVICSIGALAVKNAKGIDIKKTIVVDCVLVFIYSVASKLNEMLKIHDNSPKGLYFTVSIILVVVWLIIFIIWRGKYTDEYKSSRNITVLAVILLSIEMGLNTYEIMNCEQRYDSDIYEYRIAQAELLTSEMKKIDDSTYRVNYDWLMNPNQACLYGYYSLDLFASSMNSNLQRFLYDIGVQSEPYYITNNGNTDLVRMLTDEKYNLHAFVSYDEGRENYIDMNKVAGFGYMVGEETVAINMSSDVFRNQNLVYAALLGEDVFPYSAVESEISLICDGTSIYMDDNGEVVFSLQEDMPIGCVAVNVPVEGEQIMYSWLSAGENCLSQYSPVIASPNVVEGCGYVEHILSTPHIMRMSRDGDYSVVYILLSRGIVDTYNLSEFHFAYYDNSYIDLIQDKLSKQSFNVETFEDGYVTGNITAIVPGICFMSIPYEDGWSAIVDGKAQEITPLFNEAFVGIPLDAGYHEVELRFEAPFSRLGCIFSMFGVIMLLAIGATEVISQLKKSKIQ